MKKIAVIGLALSMLAGCKKSASTSNAITAPKTTVQPAISEAPSVTAVAEEWKPSTEGTPYQLSLKSGIFGFCDNRGSQQMDLSHGTQSAGTQTCDAKHEVVQSGCDDTVTISGSPDGGNDDLAIGSNDYTLKGHSNACDRDGKTVIVGTYGGVEVIDGDANKVAVIDAKGGDKVVIGSGWVAWHSLDERNPLQVETVSKAMKRATTSK